jgi:hypothetical protein
MTAEQLQTSIDRLLIVRHNLVQTAKPDDDGNLKPLLEASAACCAIDTAVRVLKERLREVMQ